MSTTTIHARPALIDSIPEILHWLARWLADQIVAALTHPAAGKHLRREPFGADPAYPGELHAIAAGIADDREFGLFGGDLVPETQPFTAVDFADAAPRVAAEYDATEAALTAAVLRAADATDTWGGALR